MGTCSIPGIKLILIHRKDIIQWVDQVSMKGSVSWLNTHVTCKGHASESDREASCTLFSDTLNNLASSDLYLCSDYVAHQLEHDLHHSTEQHCQRG